MFAKIYFYLMNNYEQKFSKLKQKICEIDLPIPGTLHIQYRKCGKANCRCHESKDHLHGPYYLWYRKIDGKLKTTVIDVKDIEKYQQWITNRQELELLTNEMIRLGENYAAKNGTLDNSKKT
jgi:hypothetical protein